jgi:hypothetical protein
VTISSRPLSPTLLVIPNSVYFFDSRERLASDPLEVIRDVTLGEFGKLYLTRIGALGFDFDPRGKLASINVLESRKSGAVPQHVMENHDNVILLQVRRVEFVNFVSSALFGRISAVLNTSLIGATFSRLDDIFGFGRQENTLLSAGTELPLLRKKTEEKLTYLASSKNSLAFLTETTIDNAIQFLGSILDRCKQFEYADLQSTLVMNYQAAILHGQQHATASLAINVAVAECLIKEIFYAYGLVGDRTPLSFANISHTVDHISDPQFNKMVLADQLQRLRKGKLISSHLFDRINTARLVRNKLMHAGSLVMPRQSGDCQTAVRDLWALLIDQPFELNSGWKYRF